MPERPYRRRELHDHLVRAHASRGPELQRALRLHPGWPICSCGWPVDPAAGAVHPGCEAAA
jgi:hypothetical protein